MGFRKFLKKLLFGKEKSYQEKHKEEVQNFIDSVRKAGGHVGKNFDIYGSSFDDTNRYLINIGDNVTITGATLLQHDACMGKYLCGGGYYKFAHTTIGNDVFIGKGSIILAGTSIGNKVIVGAGAVVAKDIPDNSVVIGNPAKIVCTFDDYMKKQEKLLSEIPIIESDKELQERKQEIMDKYKCFYYHKK